MEWIDDSKWERWSSNEFGRQAVAQVAKDERGNVFAAADASFRRLDRRDNHWKVLKEGSYRAVFPFAPGELLAATVEKRALARHDGRSGTGAASAEQSSCSIRPESDLSPIGFAILSGTVPANFGSQAGKGYSGSKERMARSVLLARHCLPGVGRFRGQSTWKSIRTTGSGSRLIAESHGEMRAKTGRHW